MTSNNPYIKHSIGELRAIERNLLKIIRSPRTAGHQRIIATQDLKTVRAIIRAK